MEMVAVCMAGGVVLLLMVLHISRQGQAFRERFPPISDAEFVARCSPGTRADVALKVRRIVARNLAVECARVHPSMRFVEDIGAD